MTRVLYRISRGVCPPPDRPWLDALFAELDAIDSGRARLLWLLGALGLVCSRYLSAVFRPLSLFCFVAAAFFAAMTLTSFEGLLAEDDWYAVLAAAFAACLIAVSALNLRRSTRSLGP